MQAKKSVQNNPLKDFEKNNQRLVQIEKELESADISLEQSVKLFEEAQGIIDQCQKALNQAELKIKQVQSKADFD